MTNETKLYFDNDVSLDFIKDKTVAVIGYGNQGSAQAKNLRDSGISVCIGLREGGESFKRASKDGFECLSIEGAVKKSNIISILVPDQEIPECYNTSIAPNLSQGSMLLFSHGYNIHYKCIKVPEGVDVIMVAPSGPGTMVRSLFKKGKGVPTLVAVEGDSKDVLDIALSYSKAIGGTRSCAFLSTFKEETETDLYGEQVMLTGIIPKSIKESFKVLLEGGYSPVVAWFVCFYEVKNIVDMMSEKGVFDMFDAVSDTAAYGGLSRGNRLINSSVKGEMKTILNEIKSGNFHKEWDLEAREGLYKLGAMKEKDSSDEIFDQITKSILPKLKEN